MVLNKNITPKLRNKNQSKKINGIRLKNKKKVEHLEKKSYKFKTKNIKKTCRRWLLYCITI